MASIDKAAIVFSIAITLVGVGIAAMGGSMDNSPAAPTQQMSSATNTDAAEKAADAAAAKAAAADAAAAKAAERAAAADAAAAEKAEAAAAKAAAADAAAKAAAAEKAAAADAAAAKAADAAAAKAADAAAAKAAAEAEAAAMAAAGPETHIVETAMGSGAPGCETSNACYLPEDITINAGDTVKWDNVDTAAHTVTGGSPADGPSGAFDSSLLMAGMPYSFTFDDAGYYDYFCMVHPWMVGSVTVN
ncbi:plastocyanin/azurin family copper-binding protein [Nitrosopumilus sp.]|nr:plastocyanin/azurin family copper-binding protein [Nitrosopumilus sp.]